MYFIRIVMGKNMNTRTAISDLFTREEITELTAKSDLHGTWAVFSTWAVIGGAFGNIYRIGVNYCCVSRL